MSGQQVPSRKQLGSHEQSPPPQGTPHISAQELATATPQPRGSGSGKSSPHISQTSGQQSTRPKHAWSQEQPMPWLSMPHRSRQVSTGAGSHSPSGEHSSPSGQVPQSSQPPQSSGQVPQSRPTQVAGTHESSTTTVPIGVLLAQTAP